VKPFAVVEHLDVVGDGDSGLGPGGEQLPVGSTSRFQGAEEALGGGVDVPIFVNALVESVIGLFKTELIKPRGPWRTAEQVEIATLEYVDWFNHRRLYEACGDVPPAELETAYYRQNSSLAETAPVTTASLRTHRRGSARFPGRARSLTCSRTRRAIMETLPPIRSEHP
jgi:hypothetical protein